MPLKKYALSNLKTAIKASETFIEVYSKILNDEVLSEQQKVYYLKVAIACLSMIDKDPDSAYFGYSLVVRYANAYGDYQPLHDVASAQNFMPIVDLIERNELVEIHPDELNAMFAGSLKSTFKDEGTGIYRSEGQLALADFIQHTQNIAIVAPTSYGKSEFIINQIREGLELQKKICIIVPTKALITQTRKRLQAKGIGRIITHPDMYSQPRFEYTGFVAVLTQERAVSLFTKSKDLALDMLFIDEAHNILEDDSRSIITSQAIMIAIKRNKNTIVNFYTPFVNATENLAVINAEEPNGFLANERMKVERYFYRNKGESDVFAYDQFLDKSFASHASVSEDSPSFVIEHASNKNIVYLNKPRDVSKFATDVASRLPDVDSSEELGAAMKAIASYTNPLYNIIACLKKGVLFHHGNMPDIVKMYVENLYATKLMSVRYLVTTSTLLEGVNIPANRLFIVNSAHGRGALSDSQLKNLSGRVARFNEIFGNESEDTELLEPRIYLVNGIDYERGDLGDPENFYSNRVKVGRAIKDKVKNPLLKQAKDVNSEDRLEEMIYLSNIESGFDFENVRTATTPIGKYCFEHNIRDFEIIQNENILQNNLNTLLASSSEKINSTTKLFEGIKAIFLEKVPLIEFSPSYMLQTYATVASHHEWFLNQSIKNPSLNHLINIVLYSWKNVTNPVFVGGMGSVDKYGNRNTPWRNYAYVNRENESDRVSLAISKIKVDQDMLDNCVMKYVEVMNELEILDEDYYNLVKYHTNDKFTITLLKQGVSHELAQTLSKSYQSFFEIEADETVKCTDKEGLIKLMREQAVNEIIIFELSTFI